jgi:tetratricopeptide (TPR) repeat protein
MKKGLIIALIPLILSFHSVALYSAEKQKNEEYSSSFHSSYGYYETDKETYVPTRVAPLKVLTFPLMVIASPLVFPGYYANTKEPQLKKSFHNYCDWIYFRVPIRVDEVSRSKLPRPDFSFDPKKDNKKIAVSTDSYLSDQNDQEPNTFLSDVSDDVDSPSDPKDVGALAVREHLPEPTHVQSSSVDFEQDESVGDAEREMPSDDARHQSDSALLKERDLTDKESRSFWRRLFYRKNYGKDQTPIVDEESAVVKIDESLSVPHAQNLQELHSRVATAEAVPSVQTDDSIDPSVSLPEGSQSFLSRIFNKKKSNDSSDIQASNPASEKKKALQEKADKYFERSKYSKALTYYERALILEPEDVSIKDQIQTIRMILEMQEKGKSKKDRVPLLTLPVPDDEVLVQKTIVPAHKEVYQKKADFSPVSLQIFNQAINPDTQSKIDALLKKGEKQFSKNNYDKALSYYFQVLRYDLKNEQAQKMIKTINDMQNA